MNKIKEVLEGQGRTQKWLAGKVGRSQNALTSICSNKSQPSLKLLFAIAKALGVEPCELIGSGELIAED